MLSRTTAVMIVHNGVCPKVRLARDPEFRWAAPLSSHRYWHRLRGRKFIAMGIRRSKAERTARRFHLPPLPLTNTGKVRSPMIVKSVGRSFNGACTKRPSAWRSTEILRSIGIGVENLQGQTEIERLSHRYTDIVNPPATKLVLPCR